MLYEHPVKLALKMKIPNLRRQRKAISKRKSFDKRGHNSHNFKL